jgi:hypothetical protein
MVSPLETPLNPLLAQSDELQLQLFDTAMQGERNCAFLKRSLTRPQIIEILNALEVHLTTEESQTASVEQLCAKLEKERPDVMYSELRKLLWPLVKALFFGTIALGSFNKVRTEGSSAWPNLALGLGAMVATHPYLSDPVLGEAQSWAAKRKHMEKTRRNLAERLGDPRGETSLRKELKEHSRTAGAYGEAARKELVERSRAAGAYGEAARKELVERSRAAGAYGEAALRKRTHGHKRNLKMH